MDNLAREQLEQLNQQVNELVDIYRQTINRRSVSENEFWIWYSLIMLAGEHSQHEICDLWSLSKQTVNTQVSRMVRKGYASLEAVPGTRNRKNIRLTRAGRDYGDYGEGIVLPVIQAEQRAFQRVPPDDRLAVRLRSGLALCSCPKPPVLLSLFYQFRADLSIGWIQAAACLRQRKLFWGVLRMAPVCCNEKFHRSEIRLSFV